MLPLSVELMDDSGDELAFAPPRREMPPATTETFLTRVLIKSKPNTSQRDFVAAALFYNIVSSLDLFGREERTPLAAGAADNNIKVAIIIGLDTQPDSVSGVEDRIRVNLDSLIVADLFQKAVSQT